MARGARKKPDVRLAPKLNFKVLDITKGLLVDVGKPLYYLLSLLLIAILFVSYNLGALITSLTAIILKSLKAKKKLKAPKLPKLKLKLPKVKKPKIPFKLIFLKLRLRLLRFPKIRFPKIRVRLGALLLSVLLLPFILVFSFWVLFIRDLPSPEALTSREVEVSTKIYDRNGVLLYKIFEDQNRTIVPLAEIPLQVRLATLAIEDAEFYSHPGFSLRGIFRAVVRNISTGDLSGGSTITQQLVKNALLSPEKTYTRKVREVILSIWVELTYTKDEILEMYLNEVSYGGTAYGIQEASRVYFEKNVDGLTLGEAALLAGLPKSPTSFSPFGPNPQASIERQREVLRLMVINKFITSKEAQKAAEEGLTFAPNKTDIKAPHFVMFVKQELVNVYGEEVVEKGGLEVITTLDYEIQKLAEESVKAELEKLGKLNVGNGGVLVVSPTTGEIIAMVGSKDYFDTAHDGNVNVVTASRQPGSSIKIVNYSYALSNGYTASSILSDTPVTFAVAGQPPYTPKNYDGAYRGPLSLRSALAESRNIPAVKVLASYGVTKMIEQGVKMGITTWTDPSRYGLSLTLGGGEVKLLDLAKVYATVANYGKRPEFTAIRRVTNYKGKVLDANCDSAKSDGFPEASAKEVTCEWEQALDPRVAFILIDILKDNTSRAPAFGSSSQLVISGRNDVAVKTGTSNDLRDNITVGFNKEFLVAVWVGNNDNSPMARIASGVTGAAPIWNRIMSGLLAGKPNHNWEAPQGLVQISICGVTGTLPCQGCPTKTEWFLDETKPTQACSIAPQAPKPPQILEPAPAVEVMPEPQNPKPWWRLRP